MMSTSDVLQIDSLLDHEQCTGEGCSARVERLVDSLGDRFFLPTPPGTRHVVSAVLELSRLRSCEGRGTPAPFQNKSSRYDVRRAEKRFTFMEVSRANHVPDIYAVNTSKAVRSGGPLKQAYKRTIDELGGAPKHWTDIPTTTCPFHWDKWFGVFLPRPGWMQGEIVVDNRMVAYSNVRRNGTFAFLNLLLGHGDFEGDGIMHFMVNQVVQRLLEGSRDNEHLDVLVYAGFFQGGQGLQAFKKRNGFEPRSLRLTVGCK